MTNEKIEPRLRAEMERLEQSDAPARTLSVIVESMGGHADAVDETGAAPAGVARVRKRLERLGAADVQELTLVNGVVASLTVAQIRELAGDPAVKRLVSNASERVVF